MQNQTEKNKNYPIIFIHVGHSNYESNPEHLQYVLKQARKTNPNSTIHLIGDNENNKYNFIKHHDVNNYLYNKDAQNFKKIYKHLSRSPYDSSLFVFQSWIILRDFLIEQGINKCLLIDTDIMLFADINKEFNKFKNYDFTISFNQSPHSIFFNNQKSLIDFCQFLIDIYSGKNKEGYSKIKQHYSNLKISNKLGGNVCDMTIFNLYRLKNCGKIGETTEIINNSTYDNNINCSLDYKNNYKTRFGAKKIYWINGLPYCKLLKNGKKIKFNTLHCQGSSKKYIKRIYQQKQLIPISDVILNFYKKIINKINNYLVIA